jgi:hypothetical protein
MYAALFCEKKKYFHDSKFSFDTSQTVLNQVLYELYIFPQYLISYAFLYSLHNLDLTNFNPTKKGTILSIQNVRNLKVGKPVKQNEISD